MDAVKQINKSIGHLNFSGALATPLSQSDVIDALSQIDVSDALKILNDLGQKAGSVRDPTGYVLKAASNAGARVEPVSGKSVGKGASFTKSLPRIEVKKPAVDEKLSKHIGWLNANAALVEPVSFNDVIGPLSGLHVTDAMKILKDLETSAATVKNPTGYVIKAAGNAKGGAMPAPMPQRGAPRVLPYAPQGRHVIDGTGAMPQWGMLDPTGKIGKTVGWMNHNSGLQDIVSYNDVVGALSALDVSDAMKILKDLGEHASEVKNPTAYVISAAQRAASRGGGAASRGGGAGATKEISKKIYELNQSGALQQQLSHADTIELLSAIHPSQAEKILGDLEKKAESINDPTAYVCKAAQNAGSTAMAQQPFAMMHMGGAAEVGKQIGKLNHSGALVEPISYSDVIGPLSTLSGASVSKIMSDVEKFASEIKNPTGYILKAAGNAGAQRTLGAPSAPVKRIRSVIEGGVAAAAANPSLDDSKKISTAIGHLNHFGGLIQPLSYSEIKPHLEGIGLSAAQKILEDLERSANVVKDPTNYVIASATRVASGEGQPPKRQRISRPL